MGGRATRPRWCPGLKKGTAKRLSRKHPAIEGLGRVLVDTLAPGREKASHPPCSEYGPGDLRPLLRIEPSSTMAVSSRHSRGVLKQT